MARNTASARNVASARGAATRNTASWSVQYEANELPDAATPAWTKTITGDGGLTTEEISPAGFLHQITAVNARTFYTLNDSLDNSTGSTMEARMKTIVGTSIDDPSTSPSLIMIDDDTRGSGLIIYSDAIDLNGGINGIVYEMDTTDDYHTYRLTLEGNIPKAYVDGGLVITGGVLQTFNGGSQYIYFEGGGYSSNVCEFSWDSVCYLTEGAFKPMNTRNAVV